jgi:hypothetical protein
VILLIAGYVAFAGGLFGGLCQADTDAGLLAKDGKHDPVPTWLFLVFSVLWPASITFIIFAAWSGWAYRKLVSDRNPDLLAARIRRDA